MHRCHESLDEQVKILMQYAKREPDDNPIKQHMMDAVHSAVGKARIKKLMNEPTYEAFKILKLALSFSKCHSSFDSGQKSNFVQRRFLCLC